MPVNLDRLITSVLEARNPKGFSSSFILESHENSTKLFKIYLKTCLNTKRLIENERLDTQFFDQLITNVSEVFRSAIVHLGEIVESIAVQWPKIDGMTDLEVRSELIEQRRRYEIVEKDLYKCMSEYRKLQTQISNLQQVQAA